MSTEAIRNIIRINKKIKNGHLDESISYKNYSETVKPEIENFKANYKTTPNKYLKKYLETIKHTLPPEYTLGNYQHYGNNNLHEFVWACIYYKYPHVKSLYASSSPQLYVLVHSNGIKFGIDYGAQIENISPIVQEVKNNIEIQDLIIELNKNIPAYRLTQGADYLAEESDKVRFQSKIEIEKNWDNRIHLIKQYTSETLPESIDDEILKTLEDLKPLFLKICQLDVVKNETSKIVEETKDTIPFDINDFERGTINSGLFYSPELITRYIASLATKPFVLLSGLSGSGKTKLAEAFAKWICKSEEQYTLIPVGADWTNREPLLGYVNALDNDEYILPENGALKLLIEANKEENKNKPYFLILDEMNLSHVERYFADFLSVMESKNEFKLHSSEENLNKKDKFKNSPEVPNALTWPKNLYVIGTVNIDETTYMFSPKVLDRANVIEFRVSDTDISDFLNNPKDIELEKLNGKGANMATNFIEIATAIKDGEKIEEDYRLKDNQDIINDFFKELQKSGAEFGYRTAFEISKLIYKLEEFGLSDENDKLDIAIMQKMLPKLHGSRTKLTRTLKPLAKLCLIDLNDKFDKEYFENFENIDFKKDVNIKYKLSFEKIMRMYKNAIENGFASYAEA
ncbi:McrB family protein [uncultured Winogradskyella sp.]|uniref:McrB family protein n=1 Tax=uncultured Winogradskyella sp. TaxID=395353 RepID=UPI00260D2970|nr:AAA family ATPase [uncultured Winogradskyella sp.]